MRFNIKTMVATALVVVASASAASAADGFGALLTSFTDNFKSAVPLIVLGSFILGVWFFVQAWMKLKAHKEDPRENPVQSIALNAIGGIFLIFLGGTITMMQNTASLSSNSVNGSAGVTYTP